MRRGERIKRQKKKNTRLKSIEERLVHVMHRKKGNGQIISRSNTHLPAKERGGKGGLGDARGRKKKEEHKKQNTTTKNKKNQRRLKKHKIN